MTVRCHTHGAHRCKRMNPMQGVASSSGTWPHALTALLASSAPNESCSPPACRARWPWKAVGERAVARFAKFHTVLNPIFQTEGHASPKAKGEFCGRRQALRIGV